MSKFEEGDFIRTCQECGHKQKAKNPAEYKSDVWRDLKCNRCHSPALDYGQEYSERREYDDE
jgi:hypothetical protein